MSRAHDDVVNVELALAERAAHVVAGAGDDRQFVVRPDDGQARLPDDYFSKGRRLEGLQIAQIVPASSRMARIAAPDGGYLKVAE